MTFRQNGQYNSIFGKTEPFLTPRDDVIEGSPHPKLNGCQQGAPGGDWGAKGLGTLAQTPVSGGLLINGWVARTLFKFALKALSTVV